MIPVQNKDKLQDVSVAELQEAFVHFSRASQRLEDRYQGLLKETEVLRDQLKKKDEEVCRALRLAALGETAAGLAHEVRNPLGAIKIFVSLLKQDLEDQEQPQNLIGEIEKSITTLDNVIANMLQFTKGNTKEFAPVNLHSLIREVTYHCTAPSHITTATSLVLEGNPFVLGNETGLRQVFFNLINNAIQAMGSKGSLFVSTTSDEDSVRVRVQDTGPGIAETVAENLFDPFVTTRNEGTGLGLAVVKRIIDEHHGVIRCESSTEGAVFECQFSRMKQRTDLTPTSKGAK